MFQPTTPPPSPQTLSRRKVPPGAPKKDKTNKRPLSQDNDSNAKKRCKKKLFFY